MGTHNHTHPKEISTGLYIDVKFHVPRGLCYVEPDSAPPLGCGVMGPRDCYLCWCCFKAATYTPYPKCTTEGQVWLLICAVVSVELSELPSRWPLSYWTVSSKGVILFILLGTEPIYPLLLGPPSTQGSDLIQNQNTLKFFPSSTMDSFFLVPSFWRKLERERKEKKTRKPYLE